MPNAIVRVFKTEKQARDAADSLKKGGFAERDIVVVTPPPAAKEGEPAPDPDLGSALRAGRMLGEKADFYAGHLGGKKSLVIVDPPFNYGRRAEAILNQSKALDIGPAPGGKSALDKPDIFSDFLGIPTLARRKRMTTGFFGPEIARTKVWFSYILGLDMLSSRPTPLSSLFGFSVLKSPKSNWNQSMGFSLLSSKRHIFGGKMLIKDKPAPLSSTLNLPLLSGRR